MWNGLEFVGLYRQATRVLGRNQGLRFNKRKHKINQGLWLVLHLDRNQGMKSVSKKFWGILDHDPRV
jgi:hypothetical protein